MNLLQRPFESKTSDEPGTFEGLAAVYQTVDRGNDIVMPGAFKQFELTRTGHIRILHGHDQAQPVGKGVVREVKAGLVVSGRLNMDVSRAREVYSLLRDGTLDV